MSTLKVDGIRSNSASSDAITLASDGTCTANITNRTNRNLIINGACLVAQRGAAGGTAAYACVDRFKQEHADVDESPTTSQVDIASGTTPYTLGFRKAYKITNGNQTGSNAGDYLYLRMTLEAQDIANSGWNYTSASSYITLSFWIKSSVAQNFYGYLRTHDGTNYHYPFETGSLSADTWTKVTKTIPGNSNLQFDNDSNAGLQLTWLGLMGTDHTSSSASLNTWQAVGSGNAYTPDNTTTWYTTNDSTLEFTGLQLEVGDHATDFEHRSFAQELTLCQRYYEVLVSGNNKAWGGAVVMYSANETHHQCNWVEKRATPSLEYVTGSDYYRFYGNGTNVQSSRPTSLLYAHTKAGGIQTTSTYLSGSLLQGGAAFAYSENSSAYIAVSAEL